MWTVVVVVADPIVDAHLDSARDAARSQFCSNQIHARLAGTATIAARDTGVEVVQRWCGLC